MEQTKRHTKGLWLLVLLLAVVIGYKFQPLIWSPNSLLLGDGTDGFRSFMAASYHLTHDATYSHYTGMNYPYGDRNDFTDNLPVLTNSVKFISQNIVDIRPWFTGIFNYFLLSSILLSGVFLYLIFRQLKLPLWYAIPITIGVTFLSPQISRIDAHYGLAHPFLIPMIIYFLLRFEEKPTYLRSILIGLALIFCSYFHFYLFIIPLLVIAFYQLFKLLSNFSSENIQSVFFHGIVQVLIPFLIVYVGRSVLDPIVDRPEWPYGYFVYKGYWQKILFPDRGGLGNLISDFFPIGRNMTLENTNYIGLIGMLFFFSTFLLFWKVWRPTPTCKTMNPKDFKNIKLLLLSGGIMFLLSIGFPFVIPGLESYLAYSGPYRQFRGVGRLAWAFYYLTNIGAFYFCYHVFSNMKKKGCKKFLFFAVITIVLIDAFSFFLREEWKIIDHPTYRHSFTKIDNPWLNDLDVTSFQAMIPLPIYLVGSENVTFQAHFPIMHRSLWASMETGIPIMGSFMGRTSVSQTYKLLELISPPYRLPAILNDLPNQKDLLIFGEKGNLRDVPENYEHIWKNLPQFYEDGSLILYRLPLETIRNRIREAQIEAVIESRDTTLYVHGNFWSTDSIPDFYYKNFDEQKTETSYAGTGSFTAIGFPETIVFEDKLPYIKTGDHYSIRYWCRIGEDRQALLIAGVDEINPETGKSVARKNYRLSKSIEFIHGDWALMSHTYKIKNAVNRLRLSLGHPKLAREKIEIDELLIIPEGEQVYRRNSKEVWKGIRKFDQIELTDSLNHYDELLNH